MGVMFHAVSLPFLIVLQYWLSEAQQESTQHELVNSKVGYSDKGFAMKKKKPYTAPRMVQYLPDEIPKRIADAFQIAAPAYTTVVDSDRRYVRVSDSFCELLGYKSEELIGKRYDEVTAPGTSDIPTTFSMFKALGRMQGFWMLVHRTGKRIMIRYEAWIRADSFIESKIEVVDQLR
jgi:PAS domain S-box-containing protein